MFLQTCIIATYDAIFFVFSYPRFYCSTSFSYVDFFAEFTFYDICYVR